MIVEKSFHPPILLIDPSNRGVRDAIRSYRGCIRTKQLEIGSHDVTDHRWDDPTHHWIVQVMANHTGELRMLPVHRNSRIAVLHAGRDQTTVRYQINRATRSALLGGEIIFRVGDHAIGMGPVLLYKTISYEPPKQP